MLVANDLVKTEVSGAMKNNDAAPEAVDPKPHDKLDDISGTNIADVVAKQPNTTAKQKKPYVKPAFRYERVFVTSALSCGKVSGTCVTSKVS
jgi:hypothetical protein